MVVRAWWQRGTPKEDAMRKRSEVRAAQQQTIDDAKGQGEPSKPGNFIACPREGCGTRMTAQAAKDNDGECVRCAAKLPGFGGDPVGGSSPGLNGAPRQESDPWELTPEGQKKADVERAATHRSAPGTGDEEPMSILCKRLENRGHRVSLIDLAARTPEERKLASQWVDDGKRFPQWLAKHEDKSLAIGNHAQQPGMDAPPHSPSAGSQAASGMLVVEPQSVSYTWGEEKITPIKGSFSTCSVGPFSATGSVRHGETIPQACQRIAKEVSQAAEEERDRKLQSFMRKLVQVAEQVSKAGG